MVVVMMVFVVVGAAATAAAEVAAVVFVVVWGGGGWWSCRVDVRRALRVAPRCWPTPLIPPPLAQVLGLIGNALTDASALAAAAALTSPAGCPLRRLYLNENAVGDTGAEALAAAVGLVAQLARGVAREQQQHQHQQQPAAGAQLQAAGASGSGGAGCRLDRLGLSDNAIGPRGALLHPRGRVANGSPVDQSFFFKLFFFVPRG